jgi:hypothetical protein
LLPPLDFADIRIINLALSPERQFLLGQAPPLPQLP